MTGELTFFSESIETTLENLSHWDYAQTFTARDAAYLIMGIDPASGNSTDMHSAKHIIDRMNESYDSAHGSYSYDVNGYHSCDTDPGRSQRRTELISVEMAKLLEIFRKKKDDAKFFNLLFSEELDFRHQKFSRAEMHRWTYENDFPSKYIFLRQSKLTSESTDKPLSTTERNTLLILIAALCKKAGIAHQDRTAASQIARLTDDIRASVSDETARKHLAKIPAALGARIK